ncbi:translocon-associated protein subunit beta [Nephila pilipes]|uniref:Translocon-associated protein subunit beta n=1 Tax=Nephila pilipes TaxID=299642 RepID=A0A8X6TCI0_NEPPI|nr:translocon-associated protein subunit beta [Nephila pilipes]
MKCLLIFTLITVLSSSLADDLSPARLLFHKRLLNKYLVCYSTEPGEAVIIPAKDFDRKFSPHTMDWAAFAVMTLPSLGIPFLLWYRSKSKYESISKHKKH